MVLRLEMDTKHPKNGLFLRGWETITIEAQGATTGNGYKTYNLHHFFKGSYHQVH
jgi:hypothetical protein